MLQRSFRHRFFISVTSNKPEFLTRTNSIIATMVKHGRNKKRRAGRIGKTKLKNKGNYKRWDPDIHKKIKSTAVLEQWDPSKSFAANLSAIGLVGDPNNDMRNNNTPQKTKATILELFDIPESDELSRQHKEKRRPVNEEDQKYIANCMASYGDNYGRAFRDIKINYMQLTEGQLRKLGARFLLLSPEERIVDVPEKVKTSNLAAKAQRKSDTDA